MFMEYGSKQNPVHFRHHDLRNRLPYDDNSIDIAYCISVLEHTDNYKFIIQEVNRVLRKGGIFIVTFNVSKTGEMPIHANKADELIDIMRGQFTELNVPRTHDYTYINIPFSEIVEKKDIVDMNWVENHYPSSFKPRLTFSCHTFKKI
jgi:ubiquinone/menaquinone biosynthesis C-methylase UbiE